LEGLPGNGRRTAGNVEGSPGAPEAGPAAGPDAAGLTGPAWRAGGSAARLAAGRAAESAAGTPAAFVTAEAVPGIRPPGVGIAPVSGRAGCALVALAGTSLSSSAPP